MDKELPWLADNAQLELKYKKGKTPLSHRRWPGEPVSVITGSLIQTLGDELLQKAEKKKNIVWRYENFSLEWQSAITQAINLIGEHKPSIPARTMAALACIAQNDSQQLLDEIVQQEGLEYATEVVIARQFIARCYESDPLVVTLQYQDEDYGYGYRSETYNEFDLRLRKHLSLAEESCWQRCADKLIAALPGINKVRRPFIALILPEKPEIANELVGLECPRTHFHSKEWLKVVANDPTAVRKLEHYWSQDIFSDREASYMSHENHFGYAACAALLREQGLAAIPRLAMYAHKEDCGSLLVQINHPQVIRTLLLVADKNKPSLQRVAKYHKNFPHATLAALAELLALTEPPARPGYPIIEDKKLPAQQKARDEYWRTLLQTLMASQPQLAAEVMPWLSTQPQSVLKSYLSAPPKPVIDGTDNSNLPEILVSPPWRSKKKIIGSITTCLSQAALAGLASFSQQLLEQLTLLIAQENQFAEMGQALEVLYALWRLDEISGMQGAQILQTTLCATIDRTLWLCESNGRPDEKEFHAHLHSWQALCHILRDLHSGVNLPGVSLSAAVALLERRSQAIHAPALDRGAALGALMRLEHPNASAEAALTMLAQLSPAQSGEALHGLLALARHQLACQPAFIAGFSSHLNQLSEADFINALPDLRAAMAWLPPRERGTLAHQVLEHYQLAQLPVSALQMPLHCPPQAIAHHQQLEQQALASLQNWGVFHV